MSVGVLISVGKESTVFRAKEVRFLSNDMVCVLTEDGYKYTVHKQNIVVCEKGGE